MNRKWFFGILLIFLGVPLFATGVIGFFSYNPTVIDKIYGTIGIHNEIVREALIKSVFGAIGVIAGIILYRKQD